MEKTFVDNIIGEKITFMKSKKFKLKSNMKIYLAIIFFLLVIIDKLVFRFIINFRITDEIYFDQYETYIYKEIREKLLKTKCSNMWNNQREFLNGIIRKIRPKKSLELGVSFGGSSIIILNAIKDIENSHLYSIDTNNNSLTGSCVYNNFSYLIDKWTLFKGGIAADFANKIPKDIDFVMLDTRHVEPGEILDFLMILPFLKEEAWVLFHDIDHQITWAQGKKVKTKWAPYIIFNLIRGEKFLPSGNGIFNKDIGAIKLEKNQKRFIHDYCRALGSQWEYYPGEKVIKNVINFFIKYYDDTCLNILREAVDFNRKIFKDNYAPFLILAKKLKK